MIIIKFSNLWVCALCVVLSVTPNTEQIWSIQFCSAEYPAQTELKLFPREQKPCATRHWNTRCVTQDVVSCGAPVQGAGPLQQAQSALAHGEGRWGSAWISTSLVLSYPSEAGRAKSGHCRCFVEWGQLSREKSRTLHPAEPLQSQHWLCFLCFMWRLELTLIWFQQRQHLPNHLWITWHLHRLVEKPKSSARPQCSWLFFLLETAAAANWNYVSMAEVKR